MTASRVREFFMCSLYDRLPGGALNK